jgi:hypothetical protein
MKFNDDQIKSFNRFTASFVASNQYLSKALKHYDKLIVLTDCHQLFFNLNEFDETYQRKFISNNPELYCTSLFLAIKPLIITILKNEGMTGYSFRCVFLCGDKRVDRTETVSY